MSAEPVADDDHTTDVGRLNALTDGVVAIAITLLALDLKPGLPAPASSRQLAHALNDNLDRYVTFAIAFAVVAQYWSVHHRLMRRVTRGSVPLVPATLAFLFGITLVPFTTSMNGTYGNALSTSLFALNIFVVSATASVVGWIVRRDRLSESAETPAGQRLRRWHTLSTALIPLLVAGLAWVIGPDANWLYLLFFAAGASARLAGRTGRSRGSGQPEPGR